MNLTIFTMKTLQESSFLAGQKIETAIRADVVFGSPTKRCVGIGICQVNPYRSMPENRSIPCCQRVSTHLSLVQPDRIRFRFSRKKICKKMVSRQFAFSRFRITDPLALPDWLTETLALNTNATLAPGIYPVRFEEAWIEVSIRIKSEQE